MLAHLAERVEHSVISEQIGERSPFVHLRACSRLFGDHESVHEEVDAVLASRSEGAAREGIDVVFVVALYRASVVESGPKKRFAATTFTSARAYSNQFPANASSNELSARCRSIVPPKVPSGFPSRSVYSKT